MKKLIILLSVLFLSARLFAYDTFALFAVQNAFQTESVVLKGDVSQVLFSPSLGYYMSGNLFEKGEKTGFGISNVFSIYQTATEVYINDKVLLGPALSASDNIPVILLPGVILQPEHEWINNNTTSFHFLIGMGFDLQVGSKMRGSGFGAALSVGLYPIMLANTTINGKTNSIDIKKYGRVSIGLSFGAFISNLYTPPKD